MAVVKIRLNGYSMGVFWDKVDAVEASGEWGRRSWVYGTGWPRAAAIPAKSARVVSWKSGSRVCVVSFVHHQNEDGELPKRMSASSTMTHSMF